MKAIYYLYLILIPIIILKKKLLKSFFVKKNFLMATILSLSLFLNLLTNFFNTGCFLYPAEKTCIIKKEWSIPKEEVKLMATHYEWWAKAGGGPNYKHEIEKKDYVKNFNWLDNWIERHFFNKVSDTLLGIIFISIFVFIIIKFSSSGRKKIKNKIGVYGYIIPLFFLLEWFLNHPSMRYGGYILFAIPVFMLTASKMEFFVFKKERLKLITIFLIALTFTIYNVRNAVRINKEIKVYNYQIFNSPFFFVDEVKSNKVLDNGELKIYSPKDNKMCWASKTPCSYGSQMKTKKYLWMNVVYRDDE